MDVGIQAAPLTTADELLRAYVSAGLHVVPLPPDEDGAPTKRPLGKEWNKSENLISDPDDPRLRVIADNPAMNVGVCHGPSGREYRNAEDNRPGSGRSAMN